MCSMWLSGRRAGGQLPGPEPGFDSKASGDPVWCLQRRLWLREALAGCVARPGEPVAAAASQRPPTPSWA